ncbi:MAG: DNA polymerase III subunit gamma/tau [Clostridiales Family XIII bacterium]|nr:DNA polymerase III subunit gamma/tau [Clostridiales Family XIII bacterium]
MYVALYRRFRPETFSKVLGQEHIVKILTNQIRSGTTGHAYLFCGTRGTGKTTMARLLAKGVNCLSEGERPCGVCDRCAAIRDGIFVDVIEIDAASNNSVDNIRELRESVKYPPGAGRCKVYIIDEVHMLSTGAFNALLKTLEEPPENVMFVLATTEAQKLPATILSRCLRLDFKRVPAEMIRRGMADICGEMGVRATEEVLRLLASNADGSVRDGLSLLDQCISAGEAEVTRDTVLELLGSPGADRLTELTAKMSGGDVSGGLVFLDRLLAEGVDERQLIKDWIEHFRNLMLLQHLKRPEDVLNMSAENIEKLKAQSGALSPAFINASIFRLAKILNDARWSAQPRVLLEVGMIEMAAPEAFAPSARQAEGSARKAGGAAERLPPANAPPAERKPPAEASPAESAPQAGVPPVEASPAPSSAPTPAPSTLQPSSINWQEVVKEVSKGKPLLFRLKDRSRLAETGDKTFVVEAFDEMTQKAAKEAREQIEAAVNRRAGRALRMDCRLCEGGEPKPPGPGGNPGAAVPNAAGQSTEELAQQIEKALNINVTIAGE